MRFIGMIVGATVWVVVMTLWLMTHMMLWIFTTIEKYVLIASVRISIWMDKMADDENA